MARRRTQVTATRSRAQSSGGRHPLNRAGPRQCTCTWHKRSRKQARAARSPARRGGRQPSADPARCGTRGTCRTCPHTETRPVVRWLPGGYRPAPARNVRRRPTATARCAWAVHTGAHRPQLRQVPACKRLHKGQSGTAHGYERRRRWLCQALRLPSAGSRFNTAATTQWASGRESTPVPLEVECGAPQWRLRSRTPCTCTWECRSAVLAGVWVPATAHVPLTCVTSRAGELTRRCKKKNREARGQK